MSTPITIPAAELNALIGKAIIEGLSSDTKETILAAGLTWVLEKPEIQDRYSSIKKYGDSPIEVAFKDAMRVIVRDVAHELAEAHRPAIVETMSDMVAQISSLSPNDYPVRMALIDAMMAAVVEHKRDLDND